METETKQLLVKGIDDRIVIKSPASSIDTLLQLFEEYLQKNASFLQGAKIVLDLGQNQIKSNDLFTLKNYFLDQKLSIYRVLSEDEQTKHSSELLGIPTGETQKKVDVHSILENDNRQYSEESIFLNKTIRSGSVVHSAGHMSIIGDVNPGAVVSAVGSILIWGKLKGEARAGVEGDRTRVICALEISATNIAIADVHWQNNRRTKGKLEPEIAQLIDDEIKIHAWR